MTRNQLNAAISEEIDRLWRRIDRLKARAEGRADIREISVKDVWVKRHHRGAHTRALIMITSSKRGGRK